MRSLLIIACCVVLMNSHAQAHDGVLALFTDQDADACETELGIYEMKDIFLFFIRGEGPEMGKICRFRLSCSSADVAFVTPEFLPEISTIGDVSSGISLMVLASIIFASSRFFFRFSKTMSAEPVLTSEPRYQQS